MSEGVDDQTRKPGETRFPCEQCGAVLHFRAGSQSLECQYCGHRNRIVDAPVSIVENSLQVALGELQKAATRSPDEAVMVCPSCAATFELAAHVHAGSCPFCGTPVVSGTGQDRPFKPQALLPFRITSVAARQAYRQWLDKLWFAPSELKQHARSDQGLKGIYVPYWTYDSDTHTAYVGQRGDVYHVTQRYTTVRDGRRVTATRQVPKVRWSPARGNTSRRFDDVLIGATRTLPRKITDWLEPWDLDALVPYREDYLSGFGSEVYQVELDEGFLLAQKIMEQVIRGDVRRVIGGDRQRITRLDTSHSRTTFKHILLPVWSAGYQYRGESYRFVVNARTGKVRGERPYSVWKIAAAVVAGLVAMLVFLYLAEASGVVNAGHIPGAYNLSTAAGTG